MTQQQVLRPVVLALVLAAAVAPPRATAQPPRRTPTPNDTLVSHEILPDNKVTFRIYAPKASEVSVSGDFGQGGKMTKDEAEKLQLVHCAHHLSFLVPKS